MSHIKVLYDDQRKLWKTIQNSTENSIDLSLGDKFLSTMRKVNEYKIIDHFYDKNVKKTARQVYEESILVALNLQRLGIKKGDIVILFSMNNEWISVLTFGCVLIGAIPNFFEVHLSEEHTGQLFENLQPTVILYEEKYLPKIEKVLKQENLANFKFLISIDGLGKNVNTELLQPIANLDYGNFKSVEIKDTFNEIACLVLSSGSTGIPKLVQISHALMMHSCNIWWENENNFEPPNENSVLLSLSSLRWIGYICIMFQSMLFGLRRVSCCGDVNGQYGLEVLQSTEVTHTLLVPTIFYRILLQLHESDVESFKYLKMINLGGEPPSQVIMDLTRKHAVNAKTFHCYGMTEMCGVICNDEMINGGKPVSGYEVQILDTNLKPLGPNEPGIVALRPPVPLLGYRGIENTSYLNENGLFINGDYAYMDDDGKLHVLTRYKDLIKSNGITIIPNALENIVINLPEIYVARLAGYSKTPSDPNEVGAFFVVLNSNVNSSHSEISSKIFDTIKSHLSAEQLAIIEDIYFVDSVPLTTCGKIDRVALKNLATSFNSKKKCLF